MDDRPPFKKITRRPTLPLSRFPTDPLPTDRSSNNNDAKTLIDCGTMVYDHKLQITIVGRFVY